MLLLNTYLNKTILLKYQIVNRYLFSKCELFLLIICTCLQNIESYGENTLFFRKRHGISVIVNFVLLEKGIALTSRVPCSHRFLVKGVIMKLSAVRYVTFHLLLMSATFNRKLTSILVKATINFIKSVSTQRSVRFISVHKEYYRYQLLFSESTRNDGTEVY